MRAPLSRSAVVLLFVGAGAVLLLGALTHPGPSTPPVPFDSASAETAIQSAGEPELPPNLSPGLAEIFKMAQAHVDEAVILEYIRDSSQSYNPTAEEILYLADLGLSQDVINALYKNKPAAASDELAAKDAPHAAAISTDTDDAKPGLTPVLFPKLPAMQSQDALSADPGTFHDDLAPYGSWTQIPVYGQVWQPAVETVNPDWRPYVDNGQWVSTANGLYWQSGYSWGWLAFHYGRWFMDTTYGWVWVPDKVWGNAWVSWRMAYSYAGWAALPPGQSLAVAEGAAAETKLLAATYGLPTPASWYTFVSEVKLLGKELPHYAVPPEQSLSIFSKSVAVKNYSPVTTETGPAFPVPAQETAAMSTESTAIDSAPATTSLPRAEVQAIIATASRGVTFGSLPRLGSGATNPPARPKQRKNRYHFKEHSTARANSNFAAAPPPRWDAPAFSDRSPDRAPAFNPPPYAPRLEPERMMASSMPSAPPMPSMHAARASK